jgi:transposase
MRLLDVYQVIKSEKQALRYLSKICRKNGHRICAFCQARKVYPTPDKRFRCKRCRQRFKAFTNRWYGQLNISASHWLWLIKLFELEVSSHRIAKELKISYPTALKATNVIRQAILTKCRDYELLLKGEVEADESYFGGKRKGPRGRGAKNKVPVFGILERNGMVSVDVVPNVGAKTLMNMTIKKVRRGSVVYTDKFRGYDALMFCGYRHLKVDHGKYFANGKVYINGLEGFWSFAKERLMKYHGVSQEKFPLYLKELEYRYNNRDKNLFVLLTQLMANFVPNLL